MSTSTDTAFTGSVAQFYERHMVPLIFEPYAVDLAQRVAQAGPQRVLELAAGTGVLTRQLAVMLAPAASVVATDLNPAMLEEAARIGTARPVQWREVDAMQLPFDEGAFDAVACQFGVMFFPDRPQAYAEARRVLRPGGLFAFSAWGPIAANEFADAVTDALAALYPQDPPRFMARTPHGYHDPARIAQDVAAAGFGAAPVLETVAFTSRAVSAQAVAFAYCEGTPLRGEILARDPQGLGRATQAAAAALVRRFGEGPVEGRIEAIVATVRA
ncbi:MULTISPECIES: methyltransferase domain-containing protein [Ramlibacter]|uniref:Methyltransferase domain-containing protein n=1 Tax=Ramlibacter aquaticus TaxID=2780094 RepID=A0ABR9SGY5_9BURK|nr:MULTISPECIES: methyltransferase domain-containing protein [Ramlibacter]MBE7941616.1 methyltransferase domain-containing protein [Ramlibacter aquaticus]